MSNTRYVFADDYERLRRELERVAEENERLKRQLEEQAVRLHLQSQPCFVPHAPIKEA